jgi:hypothetical protein
MENDVAELLGNVGCKLHHQELRIQRLHALSADIDHLSSRLRELKAPRQQ